MFIIPHFLHHAQLLGLFISKSSDQVFDYLVVLVHYSLIEPMLNYYLSLIMLFIIFALQILLLLYLLIATFETQRVSLNIILRIALEKKIEAINQILHQYFTFYNIFTIPIVIISVKFMTSPYGIFSYINASLQYFQGVILIYLQRNHRFAENNSFKRRFAYVQLINFTLSYIIIFFLYDQDLIMPKFFLGFFYSLFAIIDQFYSCPYRDPFREPSLKIAMILLCTIIVTFLYTQNTIQKEGQLFWILLVSGLISGVAGSISASFHEFAMTNYNSRFNLQEKYIIIGVDQFYSHFIHFQMSDYNKLVFFSQLIKHNENCQRAKCPSSPSKLAKINVNDKKQLQKLTIDIVSCIFKTCHSRSVVKNGVIHKPKFEQLQLQYISFLSQIAQRPLIGYVELRRYQQNQNNDNSLYFTELTSKISSELEFQIIYQQERMIQSQFRKERYMANEEKLTIAQLWRSVNFYQEILPKIVYVIEKKQQFWGNLIEGYNDLEPFHKELLKLCSAIHELNESIKTTIVIPDVFFDRSKDLSAISIQKDIDQEDRNINILNLKIYSILFSVILNDFDRVFQYNNQAFQAEKQIDQLIKEDRQKSIEVIDDSALLKNDAVIILVSLVKKKGHIVNKNLLTLANFFDFQNASDIAGQTLISSFLPQDLRVLHDAQMNEFVSKGFTKYSVQSIHSYYVQKKGYLKECYIKMGNLFQDSSDFILTSSILKLQPSYDIVMFDKYGKIIGVTEEFFEKRVQSNNPNLSLEKFLEQGQIFSIIPFIFINLKKLVNNSEGEFVEFAYFPEQLESFNFQFDSIFQDRGRGEQKLSSYNLTTIKSQLVTHVSAFSAQTFNEEDQVKIKGNNIPMLQQERMLTSLEFLSQYYTQNETKFNVIKIKYTLWAELMESKKEKFPYFILRIEPLSEFENSDLNYILTYTKTIQRAILSLKYGESQSGLQSLNTKYLMTKTLQANSDKQTSRPKDNIPDLLDVKAKSEEIAVEQEMSLDISALNQVKQDESKVIFENPQISIIEDQDFLLLAQEIDDAQGDKQQRKCEEEVEIDDLKYDSEKKSSISKGKTKNKKNIIEILRKNKVEKELLDHENQQSSQPSSQKTSSSKSPYLLIRTLYQFSEINTEIWLIILLNIILCLTAFTLLFIKVYIVQNQFQILQDNLNYVQNPEKINNYFLKTLMLSTNILQQHLKLASYSVLVNEAMTTEFSSLALTIETDLNSIYQDLITFEQQIIPLNEDLKIINNLKNFNIPFDLTILLEQIASNSIVLEQYFKEGFDEKSLSLFLFFRLNMVQVITVCKSYISYLNDNLIFYESQIINVLTYVIISELCIITVIIFLVIKVLQHINSFVKRILILVTKLSEEDVNQSNKIYQQIKIILQDPKQILWKQANYVKQVFETTVVKVVQELNLATIAVYSLKKGKQQKKRYQNSSLTSRVYNLQLPQIWNFAFLFVSWLFFAGYLLGALGLSISMVKSVKPALALNLQLIEFKLKFDSLVVYAETLKADYLMRQQLERQFEIKDIIFNSYAVYSEFQSLQDGFQNQLTIIYDQLASSTSLLEEQKNTLLLPFQTSLCSSDSYLIPACRTNLGSASSDNSMDYVSGGIVSMVQEFSKTLKTFWSSNTNITDSDQLYKFLSGQVHTTQFVHHFLFQGKILESIATTMLNLNKNTLDSVIFKFQIYIYIMGMISISLYVFSFYKWINRVDKTLYLTKLALTLIPSDSLAEQKTMAELKSIQNE